MFYLLSDILLKNSLTEQEEAAARAVSLGSHSARGDYGDHDSASVHRLGSARVVAVVAVPSSHVVRWRLWLARTMRTMSMTLLGIVHASQSFKY